MHICSHKTLIGCYSKPGRRAVWPLANPKFVISERKTDSLPGELGPMSSSPITGKGYAELKCKARSCCRFCFVSEDPGAIGTRTILWGAGKDMRYVVGWACGASCASPHWPPAACAMLLKHPSVSGDGENCGIYDGVGAETTVIPAPHKPCIGLAVQHVFVEGVNEQKKAIPRKTQRKRCFPWISQVTA